jgi:hypothetical protein
VYDAGQGQRSTAITRSGGPTGQGSSTGAFCDLEDSRLALLPTLGAMLRSDSHASDYSFVGQQLLLTSPTGQYFPVQDERLAKPVAEVHAIPLLRPLLGSVVMPVLRVSANLELQAVRSFPRAHCCTLFPLDAASVGPTV